MFVKEITADRVVLDTPAKINLFLQVLNRRPDGFHNIHSLFQAVSLFDRLEVELSASPGVKIELSGPSEVPLNEDNLISRAYALLRKRFGLDRGLRVTLNKQIPVAAGLAGGSSDAAATILACNLLFKLGMSSSEMAGIGLEIGSDLPFFFSSGQAIVSGRGEIMENAEYPTDYYLILVKPPVAISTAAAYAGLKRGLTTSTIEFNLRNCRTVEEFVSSLISSGNDFERADSDSYPVLGRIKGALLNEGALLARMSGSGPTMFGIYRSKPEIKDCEALNQGDWLVQAVRPVSLPGQDKLLEGGDRGDN